MTPRS